MFTINESSRCRIADVMKYGAGSRVRRNIQLWSAFQSSSEIWDNSSFFFFFSSPLPPHYTPSNVLNTCTRFISLYWNVWRTYVLYSSLRPSTSCFLFHFTLPSSFCFVIRDVEKKKQKEEKKMFFSFFRAFSSWKVEGQRNLFGFDIFLLDFRRAKRKKDFRRRIMFIKKLYIDGCIAGQ